MTRSRKLRFPMFLKFLVGCLSLAGLLIVGGTMVVKNETRARARAPFLERQLHRYEAYEARVGGAMTGTLEIIAGEAQIAESFALPPAPAPPAEGAPATAARPDAAEVAEDAFRRMSGSNGLRPDVFAVFTVNNRMVWTPAGSPIKPDSLPQLAAVEKSRAGNVFAHKLQLIDGVPYQVSALPIRDPATDQVVGGILAGVKLERLFVEFAVTSDEDPVMQIRATLLDGASLLATAWPQDKRAGLGKSMQPDKVIQIKVAGDVRDVMRLKEGDHDIFSH